MKQNEREKGVLPVGIGAGIKTSYMGDKGVYREGP